MVRTTVGVGPLLVGCLVAACSSPAEVTTQHHAPVAAPVATPAGTAPAEAGPAAAAEAALRLEALVGQHSILAADMMRARVRTDADLAQSANAALGNNTKAMGDVLEPVLGEAGRREFEEKWAEHIEALFNYSRGLATNDDDVRAEAKSELVEYEEELAEFFVAGSQGRLDRGTALAGVREHVDHLVEGADAYAAGEKAEAADLYRVSYAHSFDLGEGLARALLPPAVGRELDRPTLRLRAALTRLLEEHVALVLAAMRSAVTDGADLRSVGDAVDGNTLDLTSAVDALFGAAAAQGFQSHWADHIDELLAYTKATAAHDTAGQERARRTLQGFEQTFATFLDDATQHRLGQQALAQAFVMHDRMLLAQIDAYAAKDYVQAHDLGHQTYEEMFTVAGQLATAIGTTVASRLPTGGSQTGGGGTAGTVESR
jgi:hypothetical protein